MIEVKGLTKYYGHIAAIEDISFSVEKGEIIGFLGPNGAGKTTTMRVLTGFAPPTRGTAVIAGFDVTKDSLEVKRRVGYLPESVPLYGEMLVSSFLNYVAEIKDLSGSARKREVGSVMERCGLTHMARRTLSNLSKGYRQRVGLAQALLGNPPVLILDEPTVGLDPQQIVEIRKMIKELAHDHTVLLSTHILPEVTMVCERVVIINGGRVVAQDRMENLTDNAKPVFEVEVEGPEAAITAVFHKISSIQHFEKEETGRYRVEGTVGIELGELLARELVGAHFKLRTLHRRSRTLEDIFIAAVSKDSAAPLKTADSHEAA